MRRTDSNSQCIYICLFREALGLSDAGHQHIHALIVTLSTTDPANLGLNIRPIFAGQCHDFLRPGDILF